MEPYHEGARRNPTANPYKLVTSAEGNSVSGESKLTNNKCSTIELIDV